MMLLYSYVQHALGVFTLDIAVLLFKYVIKMNTTEISSMKSALTCKVSLLFFLNQIVDLIPRHSSNEWKWMYTPL